jgi:UDP-N-acetylmuramyl pentapeptide synthase
MPIEQVHCCGTHEAAVNILADSSQEGDWILVKGSRASQMERVVEMLAHEETR